MEAVNHRQLTGPNHFPHFEHIVIAEFSFEVKQKPAIAKVKVGVVTIRMHQFKQFRIEDLNQRPHVGKVRVHRTAVRKVGRHSFHELTETRIAQHFIVEDDQERSDKVTHACKQMQK